MAKHGSKNLAERVAAARQMESKYRALADGASEHDRKRFEALADHWREVAQDLEQRKNQEKE